MNKPGVQRFGITIPFDGVPLSQHREWYEKVVDLGYTDVWSSEVDGADCFSPIALAVGWAPTLNLGTAVAPAFTRGPALLAQSAASLADAAPGRFTLGIGASSKVLVEQWNGIPFHDPYQRVLDSIRFLRAALEGEKVSIDTPSFSVRGFRLSRVPEIAPPIYLAALRPRMLRLAGESADGAILNWLSAEDVAKAVAEVGTGREIVARIFVCPTEDSDLARAVGKRMIATYLNVDGYARYHRWLGRTEVLKPMWTAWAEGDRRRALDAIPDTVVDDLIVHGSGESCRAHIARYVDYGVTVPMVSILPTEDISLDQAVRALGPNA
jgi:probable F420-dependent oxidoreductase